MPHRGESTSPKRRPVSTDDGRQPRDLPGARLDVVAPEAREAEPTVWIENPNVAHLLGKVVEFQRRKAEEEDRQAAAETTGQAMSEPAQPTTTAEEMLRGYHADLVDMMTSVGDDFAIERDVDPAVQQRWPESEVRQAIELLQSTPTTGDDEMSQSLRQVIGQTVETLTAGQSTAREQWDRALNARRLDTVAASQQATRERRHDSRNAELRRTFGQVPAEYETLQPGDPVDAEQLQRYYQLQAPGENYIVEDVPADRVVGLYIDLPENLTARQAETLVYHRFTPDELQRIAGSSDRQPVSIGIHPDAEGAVPLTHFDLERGQARRLAERTLEIYRNPDGTISLDCMSQESGARLVVQKPEPAFADLPPDGDTWDGLDDDEPAATPPVPAVEALTPPTTAEPESTEPKLTKHCPKCGKQYMDFVEFCFEEGEVLEAIPDESEEKEEPLKPTTASAAAERDLSAPTPTWQRWEPSPMITADINSTAVERPRDNEEAARILGAVLGGQAVPADPTEFIQWAQAAEPVTEPTFGETRQAIATLRDSQLLRRGDRADNTVLRTQLYLERAINTLERSVNPEMNRARPSLDKVRGWERTAKRGSAGISELRTALAGMKTLAEHIDEAPDPATVRIPDPTIITGDNGLRDAVVAATATFKDRGIPDQRRQVVEATRRWLDHAITTVERITREAEQSA